MSSEVERRNFITGISETASTIERRIFVVGCERSGTTLLQGLLGNHPRCASIYETHFFKLAVPTRVPLRRKLGLASRSANQAFEQLVSLTGDEGMMRFRPSSGLFLAPYVRAFVQVMDTYAQQQGKTLWVEKTPSHLHRIREIQKYVPDSVFLHILRNGADVVASLYDASRRFNNEAWAEPLSLDQCIDQWITDINESARYLDKPGHFFVRYEYLTDQPQSTLDAVCEFLGIESDATIMKRRVDEARKLEREGRLQQFHTLLTEPIQNTAGKKIAKVFTAEQADYVFRRVAEVDLDALTSTTRMPESNQDTISAALHDVDNLAVTIQTDRHKQTTTYREDKTLT